MQQSSPKSSRKSFQELGTLQYHSRYGDYVKIIPKRVGIQEYKKSCRQRILRNRLLPKRNVLSAPCRVIPTRLSTKLHCLHWVFPSSLNEFIMMRCFIQSEFLIRCYWNQRHSRRHSTLREDAASGQHFILQRVKPQKLDHRTSSPQLFQRREDLIGTRIKNQAFLGRLTMIREEWKNN